MGSESAATGAGQRDQLKLDIEEQSQDHVVTNAFLQDLPEPDFFIRKVKPTPSLVFTTYWHFAKIRQDAFFARLYFPKKPLISEDPVLRRYRFTNVYRASDRVSQYLIQNVLYNRDWSPSDLVFRTMIFKFFNKIKTWEALSKLVGPVCWDNYDFKLYGRCLSDMMSRGERIYSAAYIMPSGRSAFGHERKHENHLKIIETMMHDHLPERLGQATSFESVYRLLRKYPCVGPFIGYQLAIDLNYSLLVNFSENAFVEPGPGALSGISKCFTSLGDYSPSEIISYMANVQEEAFRRYAPGFQTLWGRPLHLIDCQNLFCEVDKYARVMHPEILGHSKRLRIKQRFRGASAPIARPWYPPKWNINQRIMDDPLVRQPSGDRAAKTIGSGAAN